MKVGYAQAVITPSLDKPVFLAGFGTNRRAQSIHDDLYVRALAMEEAGTTLVLAALDLIGFFRFHVNDVIRRVHQTRPDARIIIASVHPHHGPDTMGLWGPDDKTSGVDPEYMAKVKEQTAATILASLSALQPASGKYTSVHVPGLARNARNAEIVDDELTLLQFNAGKDARPCVSLFNFPCHPEVLWEHNPHITADYPGYLRRAVEQASGGPCIFFVGALGGMMTPDVKDHSFEEAEFMGCRLAERGLQALDKTSSGALSGLSLQQKEIKVRLSNILYKLAFARKLLPDARGQDGRITTEVNLVKIGGLWLATVPGELLPKLGLQVKTQLRQAGAQVAGVIGLANDELGYMIPVEDFKFPWNPFRPGKHYEETNSIGKEVAPRVLEGLKSLL